MSERGDVLVVHTGARDHYEVAVALQEGGFLHTLVTNGYSHGSPSGLQRVLSWIPGFAAKARSRRREELPDDRVISHWGWEFVARLASRVGLRFQARAYEWQEAALARSAARLAKLSGASAVLSYNYCAYPVFRELDGTGIKRLLFQCHPHPVTARDILSHEMERWPDLAASLRQEKEISWGSEYFNRLQEEPRLADGIIAASSFTKKSLIDNGINEAIIRVVPYGSESDSLSLPPAADTKSSAASPFRILFVGQMGQRKGLTYLLDACKKIGMEYSTLVLCGRGFDLQGPLREILTSPWVEIHRDVSDSKLAEIYAGADVFVLPSLLEGFGLVILEAMSFGLPVVTTERGGGPDVIRNGDNGMLVTAGDAAQLASALSTLRENVELRRTMGRAARSTAARFTWSRFREGIRTAVKSFL